MKKLSKILSVALSMILVLGVVSIAAACKPKPIKVTFEYSASDTVTITVNSGELIPIDSLPNDPDPGANRIFKYWRDDKNDENYVASKKPSGDITLKPAFRDRNAGEKIVHFNSQGGSYVPTQVVPMGSKATRPADPKKTGGSFDYWQVISEGSFDFATVINKDYYLEAIWSEGQGKMLVQSSGDFDRVFSPFFSTSAYDGSVIGETQISMLSSDKWGHVYVGEDVPSVVKDYNHTVHLYDTIDPSPTDIARAVDDKVSSRDFYTEYEFVIKKGIRFSDGKELSIKDVLFNMYVYLDYAYNGSSTMYSTNIVGLQAYRSQDPDADELGGGDNDVLFRNAANARMTMLTNYFDTDTSKREINRYNYSIQPTDSYGRKPEQVILEDAYNLRNLFWKELKSDAMSAWALTEVYQGHETYADDIIKGYENYGFKYNPAKNLDDRWKIFLLGCGMLEISYNNDGTVKKYDNFDGNVGKPGYPKAVNDPWIVYAGYENYEKWGIDDLVNIVFNGKMGLLSNDPAKAHNDPKINDYVGNYDSFHPELGQPRVDLEFDVLGNPVGSIRFPLSPNPNDLASDKQNLNKFAGRIWNVTSDNPISITIGLAEVATAWASSFQLYTDIMTEERSLYYLENFGGDDKIRVPNISGITVKQTSSFYNINNEVKNYGSQYDVLSIKIWGVDPKAIWNFGFSVAPMHYYSNPDGKKGGYNENDGYKGFKYPGVDGYNGGTYHVGFPKFDSEYFKNVFRDPEVQGVPVGAGPFKVTNSGGENKDLGGIKAAEFCDSGHAYFRRNEFFKTTGNAMSNVKFEYMQYMVIDPTKLMDSLIRGDVDVGDPNAVNTNIEQVQKPENSHLGNDLAWNNGYGYVGVNAAFVPDLEIRKAIMTALDTTYIKSFYEGELAEIITRPMSQVSWAYPTGATDAYEFKSRSQAIDAVRTFVAQAGFTDARVNGAYSKSVNGVTRDLKFTFTIAGASTDHPAYIMFSEAAELLGECGFNITVKTDPQALSALASGKLAVWAAAWNTSIDPDMYQVYHKNSRATSTLNWGYSFLLGPNDETDEEKIIINHLSELIEKARQSMDERTLDEGGARAMLYEQALKAVMDLAVEYPTYQRKNLIVYNKNKIDSRTLVQETTAYYGLFAEIWKVRLN